MSADAPVSRIFSLFLKGYTSVQVLGAFAKTLRLILLT